jgi:hypothetical protein
MPGREAWGHALHAFGEDIGALRTAFPRLTMVPKRRLFHDLRAKTRFGYLSGVEDAEATLAHHAPQLPTEDRKAAAAQLWAAWQRFLSNEDFEDDWLRLNGPGRAARPIGEWRRQGDDPRDAGQGP